MRSMTTGLLLMVLVSRMFAAAVALPYDHAALRAARGALPPDDVAPTAPGAYEDTPDASGAYRYEATSLKPLVEGVPVTLSTNATTGIVEARMRGIRREEWYYHKDIEGGYWKLGAIEAGEYWLGLLRPDGGRIAVYLNGRMVQMGSATDSLRPASGPAGSELRATGPVHLKPGDEIAVMGRWSCRVLRLILRPEAPPAGRHYVAPHYDTHTGGPDTALAVTGQVLFFDTAGRVLPSLRQRDHGRNQVTTGPETLRKAPDGRPAVVCELYNPLPTAVEVDYEVAVRSYYRRPVGGESGRVRIAPHGRIERLVPFDALEDERAFSAELKLRVVAPADEAAWRQAMRWPALDWIDFFPGYRQGLAWPDTFADHDLRRIEFSAPVRAARRSILLDGRRDEGLWAQAFSPDWQGTWPTDEALEWEPAEMPVNRGHAARKARSLDPKAHTLYTRRTFVLPDDAGAQSCELVLTDTAHAAEMFVNGIEVGRIRGGNTPLRADASAAARPGTNELVIVTHNALSIMNPDYINPDAPEPNLDYLDAPGHWDAWGLGLGNVELHLSPRVAARALQVIPSTRQETLQARLEVVNHRDRTLKLRVRARVLDGAEPVFELGERELAVAAGAAEALAFGKPWNAARWWWPFDPHLYVMAVETFDADTGERLDLLRERFGFRESWIDGPHMMLNDMVIRPKGSWLGYREEPNHFARGVHGSAGPDWTDERGMMGGTYITSLSNTSSRHNVERDVFWEACAANAILAIQPRINNPSVMRWDMSNEWLQYLDHPNPMLGARRFKQLSDAIRALDPTRWTTFGAEGDVHGLMDHFNFHYMKPYFGTARMRGVYPYLPDGMFWRELDTDFVTGLGIPINSHTPDVILRPDEKMFFEREAMWKVGGLMPPGTAAFAGEDAILWPDWDSASGPSLWMWKQNIDGKRDVGVSKINHFTHPGVKRRAMALQTFIVPEIQHHGFGGRTLERRYAVLQDRFRTCDMTFRWILRGPDGTRLDGGEDRQRMTSGTTHRGVLRVTLPEVTERTAVTLRLELESDGKMVMAEERDLAVWPDTPVQAGPLARQVMLFEPESGVGSRESGVGSSRTAAALTAAGVAFERIEELASGDVGRALRARPGARTAPALPLLVIAAGALDEGNRRDVGGLNEFVEQGGRVLVLRQTVTPAGLPAETSLDAAHWASQCYIRAGNHPVVQGWTDGDFHFWSGDRSVTRGAYTKPREGAATVILDSGEISQENNLEWTGLVEMYRGTGLYMLCQLPVIETYDQEPMAREVLARLIDYMASGEAFREPTATLTVVADPEGPMVQRLREVGASMNLECDTGVPPVPRPEAILADAAFVRDLPVSDRAALRQHLYDGATVVVVQGGTEDADWLSELAGRPVRFAVHRHESWDGRGMRAAWTQVTAGLSQVDSYWKRFDGFQNARQQAEDTRYVIERFRNIAVSVAGDDVIESIWPGALVEVPLGQGRLILDQRNLYTAHAALVQRAARNLSALVLGVGGRIAPAIETPEMPDRIGYQPIDLSPWANRAFADETPEDGKGGWTDQGAGADLRQFPTHNRRLGGVPFVFPAGTHKCIVLRSRSRPFPERLPLSVTIPIGDQVAGFYFLHATAYGGRPAGEYEIQYEDGSSESIALFSGVNIRDWVGPASELPRERGTRSVLAWTGSTPRFPRVGIYRMEWVNPHPDKVVAAIRFHKAENTGGVPILMGLTAAVTDAESGPTDAERARAVELARRAAAALDDGDAEVARRLVSEALALDDACEAAHAVRGDLADRGGNEDERLAVYQEWIDTGATLPRPYNQVGAILERRGNLRGALDAYRASLDVEWNQPPIIEARSRVEQEVQ